MYCYNSSGLCYIDFDKDDKKVEDWIKYREYKLSESYETGTLSFQKAYLIDNTIYYKYNLDIAEDTKVSGILSIDVDSSSFDEAKQIISRVKDTGWDIDIDKKIIYYLNDNSELKKYNIETKEDETIISDIRNFEIKNEKVLYLKINNEYRETDNSIVQAATYELRLYDMNNKDDKLIFESSLYNVTNGMLNGFAQLYNEDIYYKNDNNILKYNNGKNEIVYTQEEGTLKAFKYREDGLLKIFIDYDTPKYIYNGKTSSYVPSMYSVTMKDGTTAEL